MNELDLRTMLEERASDLVVETKVTARLRRRARRRQVSIVAGTTLALGLLVAALAIPGSALLRGADQKPTYQPPTTNDEKEWFTLGKWKEGGQTWWAVAWRCPEVSSYNVRQSPPEPGERCPREVDTPRPLGGAVFRWSSIDSGYGVEGQSVSIVGLASSDVHRMEAPLIDGTTVEAHLLDLPPELGEWAQETRVFAVTMADRSAADGDLVAYDAAGVELAREAFASGTGAEVAYPQLNLPASETRKALLAIETYMDTAGWYHADKGTFEAPDDVAESWLGESWMTINHKRVSVPGELRVRSTKDALVVVAMTPSGQIYCAATVNGSVANASLGTTDAQTPEECTGGWMSADLVELELEVAASAAMDHRSGWETFDTFAGSGSDILGVPLNEAATSVLGEVSVRDANEKHVLLTMRANDGQVYAVIITNGDHVSDVDVAPGDPQTVQEFANRKQSED